MYNIKVVKDIDGNISFISCEKDGITVEFDVSNFKFAYVNCGIPLEDVMTEFDKTVAMGEELNA